MIKSSHNPEMIIIAGPNGSGKTSVTQKFLHHEWVEGTLYTIPEWAEGTLYTIPEWAKIILK